MAKRKPAAAGTEELKRNLTRRRPTEDPPIKPEDYLSTGSTLLNLACSGNRNGGFVKGKMFHLVGDSSSGKTWLSLTCFAEAVRNKHFEDHRLIFDNAEDGALMDIERYFGRKVKQKIEHFESESIEEFFDNLDDACQSGGPFIYVLDSMDSITSEAEDSKFQEQKTARKKGKEITGSFGDGKAKKNSAGIRRIIPHLRRTGSILIVISQTRDNIGFGAQFNPKTQSGGRALKFYSCLQMWSSVRGKIKASVKGQTMQVGMVSLVEVKKNRLTGKERKVEIPIYQSLGIDDVGANVDFLLEWNFWQQGKGKKDDSDDDEDTGKRKKGKAILASELDFVGSRDELIKKIETEGLEKEVRLFVQRVWDEIEEACRAKRKARYA